MAQYYRFLVEVKAKVENASSEELDNAAEAAAAEASSAIEGLLDYPEIIDSSVKIECYDSK